MLILCLILTSLISARTLASEPSLVVCEPDTEPSAPEVVFPLAGESLWMPIAGTGTRAITERTDILPERVTALEVTSKMGVRSGIYADFETPYDLTQYRSVSFRFYGEMPEKAASAECDISVTVHGRDRKGTDHSITAEAVCAAGVWQNLRFDLSGFDGRCAISTISITARIRTDMMRSGDRFYLTGLHGCEQITTSDYDSFRTDRVLDQGGKNLLNEGLVPFLPSEHESLTFDLPSRCGIFADMLYLRIDNRSSTETLTLSWKSATGFRTQRISISTEPGDRFYLVETPGIDQASLWTLRAPANTEGTLYIKEAFPFDSVLPQTSLDTHGTVTRLQLGESAKAVFVSGNVNADTVSRYSGGKLGLFSLGADDTLDMIRDGEIHPIESIPISMQFSFRADVGGDPRTAVTRQYVVLIMDELEHGSLVLVDLPKYPSARESGSSLPGKENARAFDGILCPSTLEGYACNAGFTIVPVDAGALLSENSGIGTLFRSGDSYYYVDSDYLKKLDRTVASASCGGRVYFELYLSSEHYRPDLTSETRQAGRSRYLITADTPEQRDYLSMICTFLAERYNGGNYGSASGLTLWNSLPYSGFGPELVVWADRYADAICVAAGAARVSDPSFSVFVSDAGTLHDPSTVRSLNAMDALFARLPLRTSESFPLMIHAAGRPDTSLSPDLLDAYLDALTTIAERRSFQLGRIAWIRAIEDTDHASVMDTYLRTLYAAISASRLSMFAAEFPDGIPEALQSFFEQSAIDPSSVPDDLLNAMADAGDTLDSVLARFRDVRTTIYRLDPLTDLPQTSGQTVSFDFSDLYAIGAFTSDENCSSLTGYHDGNERMLSAIFSGNGDDSTSGFFSQFAYARDFSSAPLFEFRILLPEDAFPTQVVIYLGSESSRAEIHTLLYAGENTVFCDLSDYPDLSALRYLRFRFRENTGLRVNLASIRRFSLTYSSEELEAQAESERLLHNPPAAEEAKWLSGNRLILAILVISVVSILLFLALSRRKPVRKEPN